MQTLKLLTFHKLAEYVCCEEHNPQRYFNLSLATNFGPTRISSKRKRICCCSKRIFEIPSTFAIDEIRKLIFTGSSTSLLVNLCYYKTLNCNLQYWDKTDKWYFFIVPSNELSSKELRLLEFTCKPKKKKNPERFLEPHASLHQYHIGFNSTQRSHLVQNTFATTSVSATTRYMHFVKFVFIGIIIVSI